ncbi:MAG: MmcQ/YjbR family DNA-binding protein [Pseudomonadales bacterium]
MNYDVAKAYLLSKPEAWLDYPFGGDVAVFKIDRKMFATLGEESESGVPVARMNLKCDPDEALILRDIFDAVVPGYHMNKTHWNTVVLNGSIPPGELERMIDASYGLVVGSLTKKLQQGLVLRWGAQTIFGTQHQG